MDVARYSTDHEAVFFRDGGPTAILHWFPAPPGAKVFPGPHKWGQLAWYSKPWLATGVGEIYGAPSTYNGGVTPPGVTGQDYCGEIEDFQLGPKYDPNSNTPRNQWGVAECCPLGPTESYILQEPSSDPLIVREDDTGFLLTEEQ